MLSKIRLIALYHQGLTKARPFGSGIQATQRVIEHLGYIQIDTLSVVERAHHHTLWTRVPDYNPNYLSTLVRDRRVFEYWFHAASYLPMNDFRFVLPQMAAIKRGESNNFPPADGKYMRHVLDRIRIEGPLKARNFASTTGRNSTWWDWKPAKRALERLFMQGDLMITDRDGMEKIYDLTERVLPNKINTKEPSLMEFAEYLVNGSLKANGFTTLKKLTHLRPGSPLRIALETILRSKIEQESLVECFVEGLPTVYTTPDILEKKFIRPKKNIRILSPFDNAIIHRDKVKQLYNFNYTMECYTPKQKRQYGYFCLPILYKDEFVGRVDCKAHRKDNCLELIHLHLESKDLNFDFFIPEFTKMVNKFARFNDCDAIHLSKCSPRRITNTVRRAFG